MTTATEVTPGEIAFPAEAGADGTAAEWTPLPDEPWLAEDLLVWEPSPSLVPPLGATLLAGLVALLTRMGRRPGTRVVYGLVTFLAGAAWSFYGVIRPRLQRWGTTPAESTDAMPGDEAITRPNHVITLAVTVDAPPEHIWPWLAQVGYGRGGFYSYDGLERALGLRGLHSAETILPEFQNLQVGDVIPQTPALNWTVTALTPNESMVWAVQNISTWAWQLRRIDAEHTRLITRTRARYPWTLAMVVFFLVMDLGEFLMTQRMLRGIKERAEQAAS